MDLSKARLLVPVQRIALTVAGIVLLAACGSASEGDIPPPSSASDGPSDSAPDEVDGATDDGAGNAEDPAAAPDDATGPPPTDDLAAAATPRPDWLGTRPLPLRPDGLGEIQDTPAELRDRQLPPPSDQPAAQDTFTADVGPVPAPVAARSTWSSSCPVSLDELRYVTVTFWGFDDRAYTGEMLVHESAADELVGVFNALFDARFPIEEMRVVTPEELEAPPTGDGNNTTVFVCRTTVEGQRWSDHAFGLAIDVNPFHNPYVRGDVVIPELASAYADRADTRPGMIERGDVVTEAFADIGWGWGGDWQNVTDPMHFSASGR